VEPIKCRPTAETENYPFLPLPPDFDPIDATADEAASYRRESRWTVHKKVREGVYQSYLDGRIRKIIFRQREGGPRARDEREVDGQAPAWTPVPDPTRSRRMTEDANASSSSRIWLASAPQSARHETDSAKTARFI
jgi:hypothetical protein